MLAFVEVFYVDVVQAYNRVGVFGKILEKLLAFV